MKDYIATFVEKKANGINFITDDDEVFERAIGSGRYKKAYVLTKQFSRVGYPMRLWNFRSAMVSYKHLNLWILRYDKSQRRMLCVDLNKLSLQDLLQRTLEDTVGPENLAGLQAAIKNAPEITEDLPDGVFAPGFVDLR